MTRPTVYCGSPLRLRAEISTVPSVWMAPAIVSDDGWPTSPYCPARFLAHAGWPGFCAASEISSVKRVG